MIPETFIKLYVKDGKIIPNDVRIIRGTLYLESMGIKKIENLPIIINGSLELSFNKISIIENLPEKVFGTINFLGNYIQEVKYMKNINFKYMTFGGMIYKRDQFEDFMRTVNKNRNLERLGKLF